MDKLGSRTGVAPYLSLEAHHNRLRFEAHAPNFFHAMLDLVFQRKDICGSGSAAIDNSQRVFGRDADPRKSETFSKAGALDQPRCRNLLAAFECGIAGHG